MKPIATYHCPLPTKFGLPRQSGVVTDMPGTIVFEPEYAVVEAFRGIEDFDYLWIIWQFSANRDETFRPTVRPPRLGGNKRMGVFATRSPYHPNGIGLSSVRLDYVEQHPRLGTVLHVLGADLMDGTPILDVKPYVEYADSHTDVRSGFVDDTSWQPLAVEFADESQFSPRDRQLLTQILSQDPRPRYHDDPQRIYAMPFEGKDIRFRVDEKVIVLKTEEP